MRVDPGGEWKGETSSERKCVWEGVEGKDESVAASSSHSSTKGERSGEATGERAAVGVVSPRTGASVGSRGLNGISLLN